MTEPRRPPTPTHELSARARELLAEGRARRTPHGLDQQVGYVAHPIGKDVANNLGRARRWFRWLWYRHPTVALCLPYLAPCEIFDERDTDAVHRGIHDDLVILTRCDLIFLVGGVLSPGMATELALAHRIGLAVIDYLHLGDEPPEDTEP